MRGDDAVHAREIDREPAEGRIDLTFERGAGAERDHRHTGLGAELDRLDYLFSRLGERALRRAARILIQVSVWACCSRMEAPVEKRSPNRAARLGEQSFAWQRPIGVWVLSL